MGPETTAADVRHLVVDGGKSKTDAILIDSRGTILSKSRGPGLEIIGSPNGYEKVVTSLRETLDLLDPWDGKLDTVSFGLNGPQAPSVQASNALEAIRGLTDARRYVVASDAIMNFAGTLGFEAGVVVAAGTGSVIQAVGSDGSFHRVDASGPLLGDRGSGYEVGRRGLVSAFRVDDGLSGSMGLHLQMQQKFGDVDGAMKAVYGDMNPSKVIASFSRNVADAAKDGDDVALRIWKDAGVVLALGVIAAARRAELDTASYRVAATGGLFGVGKLLIEPFEAEVKAHAPLAQVSIFHSGALEGGIAFALAPRPMWTEVSTWVEA